MAGLQQKKYGPCRVERPVGRAYLGTLNAAESAAIQGVDMNATYGFRATMTAVPGRGHELVALLLSSPRSSLARPSIRTKCPWAASSTTAGCHEAGPVGMSKLGEAWTSLSGFLLLGVGWLVFEHSYLWARLVRDVGLPKPAAWTLTWSLVVLAVSIPVGVFVSRLVPPDWSVWWLTPVSGQQRHGLLRASHATRRSRGDYASRPAGGLTTC